MKFGITLSNRGVLVGLCSVARPAHACGRGRSVARIDSVWCGDALFVNRRLDALTLLSAVAGRTERVLLGPACMGSFALRNPMVFAYEWASLDVLSNGRTRLVACAGGGAGPAVGGGNRGARDRPEDRRKRMVENMHILRHLWTRTTRRSKASSSASPTSRSSRSPCRTRVRSGLPPTPSGCRRDSRIPAARISRSPASATVADGWMTHSVSPAGFRKSWDFILQAGARQRPRHVAASTTCSIITSTSATTARRRSPTPSVSSISITAPITASERLEAWLTYGTPRDCIAHLKSFKDSGCSRITFRISTMGDPMAQLRRVTEEVLPYV